MGFPVSCHLVRSDSELFMNNKQVKIFLFSLCFSLASFVAFVYLFPFPRESEVEIYEKFVPWVATRTSLYTPYKYWWPLALVFIPGVTYVLWYILALLQRVPLMPRTFWKDQQDQKTSLSPIEIGIVCISIVLLLVNFSYSAFYQFFYNYHHLNFITGPLSDILSGKLLLIDVKAQYGFLHILLASFIFKYVLYFSHANVHFVSMILGCIEYLMAYLIIRKLTNSAVYSLSGLFFLVAIHFYGVFGFLFPSELYVWPGGSVWRFFPAIPTAWFLLLWLRTTKWRWGVMTQISVVTGILWNIEAGAPLVVAYLAVLILRFWYSNKTWLKSIQELLISFGSLVIIFAIYTGGYSLYTFVLVGSLPQWENVYYFTVLFNSGFLQNRVGVPAIGIHYWPIVMYAVTIFLVMLRKYTKRGLPVVDLTLLSFLAVYGYGIYRYYIGKQSSSDLAAVILPAGIIFLYYFYQVFQRMLQVRPHKTLFAVGILMSLFFVFQQARFVYWTGKLFMARYTDYKLITTDPNINHPARNRILSIENTVVNTIPWTEVESTIKRIEKYVPAGKPIALLAYFDHILLMQSGRTNIADYWYLHSTIYTNEEVTSLKKEFKQVPYLFVDKRLLRHNPKEYVDLKLPVGEQVLLDVFQDVRPQYEFVEDIGMLYVYKQK